MKFKIEIDCSTEPFLSNHEDGQFDEGNADSQVATILERLVIQIDKGEAGTSPIMLWDSNGNHVGNAVYAAE